MRNNEGLKRRVLRDDVVEHIVDSILNKTLKPGERIVETRVSRELNVSQGAVREAIRDLTARGLVETEPYKGSRVKVLSEKDMHDYFAVRRELEPLALSWAVEINAIDTDELHDIVNAMKVGVDTHNLDVVRKEDFNFHRKIVEFSQNMSLVRSWESLANEYWIYTMVGHEFYGLDSIDEIVAEHRSIVEAIESGDTDAMKRTLQNHFLKSE